jgi:nondiscriminating aspartyl-tRNA synthetase
MSWSSSLLLILNYPYPVNQDPAKHNIDAILDNRLISLRMPKVRAIFELQSAILKYLSQYMHSQDFSEIKTSKLIGSGTEGGTGLFEVEYFEDKVYLAQSPQFYKQAMVSSGLRTGL